MLSGSVPSEIWLVSTLEILGFGNNLFSGTIATEVGLTSSLIAWALSGNILTGTLPTEIGKLSNSLSLELEDNVLTGPLPSEYGLLRALQYFWLHNNALTGSLPSELGQLSLLEFDLSNNILLSGSIPQEIGELGLHTDPQTGDPMLGLFKIRGTGLTGTVPDDLCFLNDESCFYFQPFLGVVSPCSLEFDCGPLLCGCGDYCPCPDNSEQVEEVNFTSILNAINIILNQDLSILNDESPRNSSSQGNQ